MPITRDTVITERTVKHACPMTRAPAMYLASGCTETAARTQITERMLSVTPISVARAARPRATRAGDSTEATKASPGYGA